MSALRPPAALAAAAFLVVSACTDLTEPPLGGHAALTGGVLTVEGDDAANRIAILYSADGVDVQRDGDAARFTDPVTSIAVVGGAGSDVIRYDQTVVADVELTVRSGEGDDEVVAAFAPTGSGAEMTLVADLQTGPGSDLLDIRWDGTAVPALKIYAQFEGETQGEIKKPQVGDEVLVSFQHGDPDRPVVLGMVWNAEGAADTAAGGATGRLELEFDFRSDSANTRVLAHGDYRRDSLDVRADYSGVLLQQGRVSVDADMNEGDNHVGTYIVTSAAHTLVDTRVVAGDGNNVVALEDVFGGDGERTYTLDLGDGDNQTSVSFGDGLRGRRPSTGTRTVDASYRSGAGTNGLVISADLVEPLASSFAIDYGAGQGDTYGRYKVKFPWDRAETPTALQPAYSARLAVTSPGGSDLDFRIDIGHPAVDDPAAFGVVTATAAQTNQSDLAFLHRLAEHANSTELEQEWEVRAAGLAVADSGSIVVDAPPGLERLVYLQDDATVADGASMDVTLNGDSAVAMLAHLIGVSGAGRYDFGAGAGAASPLVAVLTRDLTATGAGFGFNLAGGTGDDALGLDRPALGSNAPVSHAIAGGTGSDTCYAAQDVAVTGCEQLDTISDALIRMIETTFGTALADVWRQ